MKEYLREIRAKKMYEMWEEYKNRITMEELGKIFNTPVPTTYKIIKKENEKKHNLSKG